MSIIRNAHFDFRMNIAGERASSISQRALEILQEHLDGAPGRPQTIGDLEVDPIKLPGNAVETEEAARRIAGAVYSSIGTRVGRNSRG